MIETIIENEFITLSYYHEKKIVAHKLRQFATGKRYRDAMNTGTELLIAHGAQKWLSDDREFSVLHPSDRKWGITDWTPRTIEAGWKYWAIIMPESIIGQASNKRMIESLAGLGVEVQIFSTTEEAFTWLDSKE